MREAVADGGACRNTPPSGAPLVLPSNVARQNPAQQGTPDRTMDEIWADHPIPQNPGSIEGQMFEK